MDLSDERRLTRQRAVDIETTSSLTSSPPPAAKAEDGLDNLPPLPREQPGSPAFSTSSTAEGGSSPVLPPLPAPTINGHILDLLKTPPPSTRAESIISNDNSSHYYTASWGSPYQQPPRNRALSHTLSSEASEDSPIRHLEFHTPFLRPAPTFTRTSIDPDFVSNDGLISAAVLANRARRAPQGLTEDWIRAHTGGEDRERNHWLSDGEGESENSSLSGSISGNWLSQDNDPKTPTLKRFLESREQKRAKKPGHQKHNSTATLKQADFLEPPPFRMSEVKENATSSMEPPIPSPEEERPPPLPPKEAQWRAAALPAPTLEAPAPAASPAPAPLHLKKKLPWKGKSIMVLLPQDDERGQRGKAPAPMTEKDVAAMLKEWEQLGYDTTGFNLGQGSDHEREGEGQSRSPWPLAQDIVHERQDKSFKVSIPDRREWDAYVNELAEAKLRALGVTLGDEEPAPLISPAASNMSRQTSTQYPALPFSPPLPSASAASSHMSQNVNPFSPTIMPGNGLSTSQSSNPGSIASPASMQAHLQGKFNPRQSVSFSAGEHPFGSPFQYPQQQSPGVWSPQQMLYQQEAPRGGSPSLQNLGAILSPSPPFSQDGYFPQPPQDVLSQLQQRQQMLQNQRQHQHVQMQAGARASPRLQEVREIPDEEVQDVLKSPSKTPEARQIRHNPSESLQDEIDAAEYHLEEQMQRQLEHEDYSPHSDKGEDRFETKSAPGHSRNVSSLQQSLGGLGSSRYAADDSEDGPVLHHPQPHSRGHSLSQRPFQDSEESTAESKSGNFTPGSVGKGEVSDIETNPSNLGTPMQLSLSGNGHDHHQSLSSNPWVDSEPDHKRQSSTATCPGHSAKPSMSKLNVAAKEFKFDPTSAFKPGQFSFGGGNNFQPPAINAFQAFAAPQSATSSHFSNHSLGSGKSKINVAAPEFMPGQSEFSFSASVGPSFRPDAPAFTPLNTDLSQSVGSNSEGPRSSLFGNIDLSALGISKPSKKSKAIPIVRPDSSHSRNVEDETMEGKDGRITQGEGRIKRAKADKDDGDSVPLFAEPSMPLSETTREQSPPKENLPGPTTQADKENSAPLDDSGQENAPPVPAKSGARALEDTPNTSGKEFAPWEFQQHKQAEDFNAARPFTSKRYQAGLPAYGNYEPSEEEATLQPEPTKPKGHKKNSLSATAKPFEFKPGAFNFTFSQPSEPKPAPVRTPSLPTSGGLSASRFARSPTPPTKAESPELDLQPEEMPQFQAALPQPESPPTYAHKYPTPDREPTFEEIDAVMRHLNEAELDSAPTRDVDSSPRWHQPSPQRRIQVPDMDNSSPIRLQPQNLMRSDAPSPSPRRYQVLPGEILPQQQRIFSRGVEDPFIGESPQIPFESSPVHRLNNGSSIPPSDWDDVISETEDAKLQPRAQFFDNHVNDLVGGLLEERLNPLERALETIQMSIEMMAARAPSSRRERRSISGALSDADDEDDDNDVPRRSLSPRRDKKLEKIRSIVTEALNAHQTSRPATARSVSVSPESENVMKALQEMRDQFGQSMRLDFRAEDLRNVVEEAVEKRMGTPKPVVDEVALARDAEQKARIADLEERLARAESGTEEETKNRRAAEDRLAEIQRLLRISSEEEVRLREAMDQREIKIREIIDESDQKVRAVEESRAKTTMRIALLEASQDNAQKTAAEVQNRINITETGLREARQQIQHWQMEAERALEAARRHSEDAEMANETNKDLRRTIERLRTQMEESIRVREGMRGKLMDLQEDMAAAARDISDENARRAKKEQELIAHQEVLDAKLQAEARTRERLEQEIERLEHGEREGMRAVSELKRVEGLVMELKNESHNAQKEAMRYQREFEEAKESGLSEVKRTRQYMQVEIDTANNQVNVVRDDLENQIARLHNELDQVKLDADAAREKNEMLLEEANGSKTTMIEDLKREHADALDDIHAQHERQLNNTVEDAQRSEQHLLERLSLSNAKTEHLQDRVVHLEEKLEIANQAANAAAVAAKSARSVPTSSQPASIPAALPSKPLSRTELPEKISPQALRESIMVLQEQLQDREQTIEKLEATITTLDPDSANKISKRDDEILWLRELLSVRKSDLTDIVQSLEGEQWDGERVRDAAIRLRANLQMEEQERERAMNGGSALNLPNIAASLRDAASPRVAQAVGPLAAAWGNWRKGRGESNASEMAGGRSHSSTPSRNSQSFLSGLMTPPASSARTPGGSMPAGPQPTAFGSTGQRFTREQLANRPTNMSARQQGNMPMRGVPRRESGLSGGGMAGGVPSTPPMMRKSSYDADAMAGDFSDAGFYDDDESTVDDYQSQIQNMGR